MSRPRAKSARKQNEPQEDEVLIIEFNKGNSYKIKRRSGTPHQQRERAPPDGQATNGDNKSDGVTHDDKYSEDRPKTGGSTSSNGQYPKISAKLSKTDKYYTDKSIYMDFPGRSRAKSAVCKAVADQMKKSFDEQTSVSGRERPSHKSPSHSRSSSLSRNSSRIHLPYINQNWDRRSLLSLKSSLSGSGYKRGPRTPRTGGRAQETNSSTTKTSFPKFDGNPSAPKSAKTRAGSGNLQVKIPNVENNRSRKGGEVISKQLPSENKKSNRLAELPKTKSCPRPHESTSPVRSVALPREHLPQTTQTDEPDSKTSKTSRGTILKLILSSGAKVSEGDDGSIIIEEIPKKRKFRKNDIDSKERGIQMAIETRAQTPAELNGFSSTTSDDHTSLETATSEEETGTFDKGSEKEEYRPTSVTQEHDSLQIRSPSPSSSSEASSLSTRTHAEDSESDSDLSESYSSATSEQLLSRNRQQKQDSEMAAGRLEAVDEASEEETGTANNLGSGQLSQGHSRLDLSQGNGRVDSRPESPKDSSADTVDQAAEIEFQERVSQSEHTEEHQQAEDRYVEGVTVEEFRVIYRQEILELNANLEKFKNSCRTELAEFETKADEKKSQIRDEIQKLDKELEQKRKQVPGVDNPDGTAEPLSPLLYDQTQREATLLEKESRLLKTEEELLHKEEELFSKQRDLKAYEKEIEDVEGYLDRRHELTKRKEEDIQELDKEVQELKDMLTEEKTKLRAKVDAGEDVTQERSKLAQLQWQFVRSTMVEEQAFLTTALNRCRSELSESKDKVQQKTRELQQCQHAVTSLQEQVELKNKKIRDLQERLLMHSQAPKNLSLARSTSLLALGTNNQTSTQIISVGQSPNNSRPSVHVPVPPAKGQQPSRRRSQTGKRPQLVPDTRGKALEQMVQDDMRRRREQLGDRRDEQSGESAVCSIQ